MAFSLIDLPFAQHALEPAISRETIEFHYGKHHAKYVETTNSILSGSSGSGEASLVETVRSAHAAQQQSLFNNAAQVWNHNFYWLSLTPAPEAPSGVLATMIADSFGGIDHLHDALLEEATRHFSNGWVWLVREGNGLAVRSYHDADTPLVHEAVRPLLTIDIWEHAYYIDHRNARHSYVREVMARCLNWAFAAQNLDGQGAARADQEQA